MNKRISALMTLMPFIALTTLMNVVLTAQRAGPPPAPSKTPGPIARMPDGKPDLTGFYQSDAGGANYGLERHDRDFLTPGTKGVVIDPPDGKLPTRPWVRAERIERGLPLRGYGDPNPR